MEPETVGVLQGDSGASPEGTAKENLQSSERSESQAEVPNGAPAGLSKEQLERIPPEFRPDENGKWPEITPKLIRQMRGKYFTVKHVALTNCGHKIDMINQPKNNCENCWYQWFNTHPQLVETADQFFRTHGKGPLIGMRGEKFFKMFVRYMATVIHFMKEEEALKAAQEKTNESSGEVSGSTASPSSTEEREAAPSGTVAVEGGQAEGN